MKRKWRENEEMKRKWRDNEEIERKWRENEEMERDSLSTFPHSLFISSLSIYFLHQKRLDMDMNDKVSNVRAEVSEKKN